MFTSKGRLLVATIALSFVAAVVLCQGPSRAKRVSPGTMPADVEVMLAAASDAPFDATATATPLATPTGCSSAWQLYPFQRNGIEHPHGDDAK